MPHQLGVVGIHVDHRYRNAPEVQKILTDHGEMIRCRTGLSQQNGDNGLITLSVESEPDLIRRLEQDLSSVEGVRVKAIIFEG